MRLAGQAKLGFYPAAPGAIAELAKHLFVPAAGKVHILDPCAGCGTGRVGYDGAAIKQIAESLAIPFHQVYAIELDDGRGEKLRAEMPDANILAPCSFFSTSIMASSFGMVYCNPPFDHELGGGEREEEAFARACYRLLAPNGLLVLVAPFATYRVGNLCVFLDTHFKDAALYRFPDGAIPYRECVFIGMKRNVPLTQETAKAAGYMLKDLRQCGAYGGAVQGEKTLAPLGGPQLVWENGYEAGEGEFRTWTIQPTFTPSRFLKAGYTDPELVEAITASPLNQLVMGVEEPPIKEPPLPLEKGHVAMLLASGALDGLVETPDGNHVVRGVATKVEEYNEEASDYTVTEAGDTAKIKEVYSQQITLKVRALDETGIYTFMIASAESTADKVEQGDVSYQDWDLIQKLKMVTVKNGATPGEEAAAKERLKAIQEKAKKNPLPKTGTSG